MNARDERIDQDISGLKALRAAHPEIVESVKVRGKPISTIRIGLRVLTAESAKYPEVVQVDSQIEIELSAQYPFIEPVIKVLSPVWNPNVYPSGLICLGRKWIITEGLALLVIRVIRLLAFDPQIINTSSPANTKACEWYLRALRKARPGFPSINLNRFGETRETPVMKWRDIR